MVKTTFALVGALALGLACGTDRGQGPSAVATPSPPAAAAFTVVSGETGATVPGARVVVNGIEHVADGQGRVTAAAGLPPSALVDIVAPGFFDRQTQISRGGSPAQFTLWPREGADGLTEHVTAELVYTTAALDEERVIGAEPLRRWAAGVARVEVVYQGSGDDAQFIDFGARARDAQRAALDEINRANGSLIYAESAGGPPAPGAGRVAARIFPQYSVCQDPRGFAALATVADGEIFTATITYCSVRSAESASTSAHELGHTFGLRHSSNRADVMFPISGHPASFTARESTLMALMLQRRGGNRFPDNDRTARVGSARVVDVVCGP